MGLTAVLAAGGRAPLRVLLTPQIALPFPAAFPGAEAPADERGYPVRPRAVLRSAPCARLGTRYIHPLGMTAPAECTVAADSGTKPSARVGVSRCIPAPLADDPALGILPQPRLSTRLAAELRLVLVRPVGFVSLSAYQAIELSHSSPRCRGEDHSKSEGRKSSRIDPRNNVRQILAHADNGGGR